MTDAIAIPVCRTTRHRECLATDDSSLHLALKYGSSIAIRIVVGRSPSSTADVSIAVSIAYRVINSCAFAVNVSASASKFVDSACASSARTRLSIGSFVMTLE